MSVYIQKNRWLSPVFYMTLAMVMWAVIEYIPHFFSKHYTTFEIVWMRYSVHMIFMLIVFGPRVKTRLFRTRKLGQQLVRGMLMMGMHLTFIFALAYMPVTGIMAGFWVAPLLLLGLSGLFGERTDWEQWLFTLVMYASVLFISHPLDSLLQPAILLPLGMAVCFVVYLQMTRSMRDEDLLASLFYTAFSVWVVLSVLMLFYWITPTGVDLLLFAAIGLLGFVCIYGFDKALESAPSWQSAPFAYIQPVLVILFDWGLRGIIPGRLRLAASGLVLVCLSLLAWRNYSTHKSLEKSHV